MGEHVAIEGIERGLVDVRNQNTFAQIIQHQDARSSAESTKSFLVQFGPDTCAGAERQQPYCLATIAQRKHEQTGASILAALRFAYHRPAAVINLTLLSCSSEDHRPCLWYLGSTQFVSEAPNALIATLESVVGDQVLPDGPGIAIPTQTQLDDFPVGFTATRRACAFRVFWLLAAQPRAKAGDHRYGRF